MKNDIEIAHHIQKINVFRNVANKRWGVPELSDWAAVNQHKTVARDC